MPSHLSSESGVDDVEATQLQERTRTVLQRLKQQLRDLETTMTVLLPAPVGTRQHPIATVSGCGGLKLLSSAALSKLLREVGNHFLGLIRIVEESMNMKHVMEERVGRPPDPMDAMRSAGGCAAHFALGGPHVPSKLLGHVVERVLTPLLQSYSATMSHLSSGSSSSVNTSSSLRSEHKLSTELRQQAIVPFIHLLTTVHRRMPLERLRGATLASGNLGDHPTPCETFLDGSLPWRTGSAIGNTKNWLHQHLVPTGPTPTSSYYRGVAAAAADSCAGSLYMAMAGNASRNADGAMRLSASRKFICSSTRSSSLHHDEDEDEPQSLIPHSSFYPISSAPLLYKEGTSLYILLQHIQLVCESEVLFPVVGHHYLDVLVWLVRFDAYRRCIDGKKWILPMIHRLMDLLERVSSSSGAAAVFRSDGTPSVGRSKRSREEAVCPAEGCPSYVPTEEEGVSFTRTLDTLVALPQFVMCMSRGKSASSNDADEESASTVQQQLLYRFANFTLSRHQQQLRHDAHNLRLEAACLRSLRLLTLQLHSSSFSSPAALFQHVGVTSMLHQLTACLCDAAGHPITERAEAWRTEVCGWWSVYISLSMSETLSHALVQDLGRGVELNQLDRPAPVAIFFQSPTQNCFCETPTAQNPCVRTTHSGSSLFLESLFESIWPMIARQFFISTPWDKDGTHSSTRRRVHFNVVSYLELYHFPGPSSLQLLLEAGALVLYTCEVGFECYLRQVMKHETRNVATRRANMQDTTTPGLEEVESGREAKDSVWRKRLAVLRLPETGARCAHHSNSCLERAREINCEGNDAGERERGGAVWVASPVSHVLFHLYREIYGASAIQVSPSDLRPHTAEFSSHNDEHGAERRSLIVVNIEEVRGVDADAVPRPLHWWGNSSHSRGGESLLLPSSAASSSAAAVAVAPVLFWLHLLAQPSALLHASAAQCDGLVFALLPLWKSGLRLASMLTVWEMCSVASEGRPDQPAAKLNENATQEKSLSPMVRLSSLLWAVWTAVCRRCTATARRVLVRCCITHLFPSPWKGSWTGSSMSSALLTSFPNPRAGELMNRSSRKLSKMLRRLARCTEHSSNPAPLLRSRSPDHKSDTDAEERPVCLSASSAMAQYFALLHTLAIQELAGGTCIQRRTDMNDVHPPDPSPEPSVTSLFFTGFAVRSIPSLSAQSSTSNEDLTHWIHPVESGGVYQVLLGQLLEYLYLTRTTDGCTHETSGLKSATDAASPLSHHSGSEGSSPPNSTKPCLVETGFVCRASERLREESLPSSSRTPIRRAEPMPRQRTEPDADRNSTKEESGISSASVAADHLVAVRNCAVALSTLSLSLLVSMTEWLYRSSILSALSTAQHCQPYDKRFSSDACGSSQGMKGHTCALDGGVHCVNETTSFSNTADVETKESTENSGNAAFSAISPSVGVLFCTLLISHGPHALSFSRLRQQHELQLSTSEGQTTVRTSLALGSETVEQARETTESFHGTPCLPLPTRERIFSPEHVQNAVEAIFGPDDSGTSGLSSADGVNSFTSDYTRLLHNTAEELEAAQELEDEAKGHQEDAAFLQVLLSSESYVLSVASQMILSSNENHFSETSAAKDDGCGKDAPHAAASELLSYLIRQSREESLERLTSLSPQHSSRADSSLAAVEPLQPYLLLPSVTLLSALPHWRLSGGSFSCRSEPSKEDSSVSGRSNLVAEANEEHQRDTVLRRVLRPLRESQNFFPAELRSWLLQSVASSFLCVLQRRPLARHMEGDSSLRKTPFYIPDGTEKSNGCLSALCLLHWVLRLQQVGVWTIHSSATDSSEESDGKECNLQLNGLSELLKETEFKASLLPPQEEVERQKWMMRVAHSILKSKIITEEKGIHYSNVRFTVLYHLLIFCISTDLRSLFSVKQSSFISTVGRVSGFYTQKKSSDAPASAALLDLLCRSRAVLRTIHRLYSDVGDAMKELALAARVIPSAGESPRIVLDFYAQIVVPFNGLSLARTLTDDLTRMSLSSWTSRSTINSPSPYCLLASVRISVSSSVLLALRASWRCLATLLTVLLPFFLESQTVIDNILDLDWDVLSRSVEDFLEEQHFIAPLFSTQRANLRDVEANQPSKNEDEKMIRQLEYILDQLVACEDRGIPRDGGNDANRISLLSPIILELLPLLDILRVFYAAPKDRRRKKSENIVRESPTCPEGGWRRTTSATRLTSTATPAMNASHQSHAAPPKTPSDPRWLWLRLWIGVASRLGGRHHSSDAQLRRGPASRESNDTALTTGWQPLAPTPLFLASLTFEGLIAAIEESVLCSSQVWAKASEAARSAIAPPWEPVLLLEEYVQYLCPSNELTTCCPQRLLLPAAHCSLLRTLAVTFPWTALACGEGTRDAALRCRSWVCCTAASLSPSASASVRIAAGRCFATILLQARTAQNGGTTPAIKLKFSASEDAMPSSLLPLLLEGARDGLLRESRSGKVDLLGCGTSEPASLSLLAMAEAAAAATEAETSLLYTVLECWSSRTFAAQESALEWLTLISCWKNRLNDSGETPKSTRVPLFSASKYYNARQHVPEYALSCSTIQMCRVHFRSVLFHWLWWSQHSVDAFPYQLFGYSSLSYCLLDHLPFILMLGLLLGARGRRDVTSSTPPALPSVMSYRPSSLYNRAAKLYYESSYSSCRSSKNSECGEGQRKTWMVGSSVDLSPVVEDLPRVMSALLLLIVPPSHCEVTEAEDPIVSFLEGRYTPAQRAEWREEALLVMQWLDYSIRLAGKGNTERNSRESTAMQQNRMMDCKSLPGLLLQHFGPLLVEVVHSCTPNRKEYLPFCAVGEGEISNRRDFVRIYKDEAAPSSSDFLVRTLIFTCEMFTPFIKWQRMFLLQNRNEHDCCRKKQCTDHHKDEEVEEISERETYGTRTSISCGLPAPSLLFLSEIQTATALSCAETTSHLNAGLLQMLFFSTERHDEASASPPGSHPLLRSSALFSEILNAMSIWSVNDHKLHNAAPTSAFLWTTQKRKNVVPESYVKVGYQLLSEVRRWFSICTELVSPKLLEHSKVLFNGASDANDSTDACLHRTVCLFLARCVVNRSSEMLSRWSTWSKKNSSAVLEVHAPDNSVVRGVNDPFSLAEWGAQHLCDLLLLWVPYLVWSDWRLKHGEEALSLRHRKDDDSKTFQSFFCLSSETLHVLRNVSTLLCPSSEWCFCSVPGSYARHCCLTSEMETILSSTWNNLLSGSVRDAVKRYQLPEEVLPLSLPRIHLHYPWSRLDSFLLILKREACCPQQTSDGCTAAHEEDASHPCSEPIDCLPVNPTEYLAADGWERVPSDLSLLVKLNSCLEALPTFEAGVSEGLAKRAPTCPFHSLLTPTRREAERTVPLSTSRDVFSEERWAEEAALLERVANHLNEARGRLALAARLAIACSSLGASLCSAIRENGFDAWAVVMYDALKGKELTDVVRASLSHSLLLRHFTSKPTKNFSLEEPTVKSAKQLLEALFRTSLAYDVIEVMKQTLALLFRWCQRLPTACEQSSPLSQLLERCTDPFELLRETSDIPPLKAPKRVTVGVPRIVSALLDALRATSWVFIDVGLTKEVQSWLQDDTETLKQDGSPDGTIYSWNDRESEMNDFTGILDDKWQWLLPNVDVCGDAAPKTFLYVSPSPSFGMCCETSVQVDPLEEIAGEVDGGEEDEEDNAPVSSTAFEPSYIDLSDSRILLSCRPWYSASPTGVALPRSLLSSSTVSCDFLGDGDGIDPKARCSLSKKTVAQLIQRQLRSRRSKNPPTQRRRNTFRNAAILFSSFLSAYSLRAPQHHFMTGCSPSHSTGENGEQMEIEKTARSRCSLEVVELSPPHSTFALDERRENVGSEAIEWMDNEVQQKKIFLEFFRHQFLRNSGETHGTLSMTPTYAPPSFLRFNRSTTSSVDHLLLSGYLSVLELWKSITLFSSSPSSHRGSASTTPMDTSTYTSSRLRRRQQLCYLASNALMLCGDFLSSQSVVINQANHLLDPVHRADRNGSAARAGSGTPQPFSSDLLQSGIESISDRVLLLITGMIPGNQHSGRRGTDEVNCVELCSSCPFFPVLQLSCERERVAESDETERRKRRRSDAVSQTRRIVLQPSDVDRDRWMSPSRSSFHYAMEADPLLCAVLLAPMQCQAATAFLNSLTTQEKNGPLTHSCDRSKANVVRLREDMIRATIIHHSMEFFSSDALRLEDTSSRSRLWSQLLQRAPGSAPVHSDARALESAFLPLFVLAAIRTYDLDKRFVLLRAAVPLLRFEAVEALLRVALGSTERAFWSQLNEFPMLVDGATKEREDSPDCGLLSALPRRIPVILINAVISAVSQSASSKWTESEMSHLSGRQTPWGALSSLLRAVEEDSPCLCTSASTTTKVFPVVWAFMMLTREDAGTLTPMGFQSSPSPLRLVRDKWSSALSSYVFNAVDSRSKLQKDGIQTKDDASPYIDKCFPHLIDIFLHRLWWSCVCRIEVTTKRGSLQLSVHDPSTRSHDLGSKPKMTLLNRLHSIREHQKVNFEPCSTLLPSYFTSLPLITDSSELHWLPNISAHQLCRGAALLATSSPHVAPVAAFWLEMSGESFCGRRTGLPTRPLLAVGSGEDGSGVSVEGSGSSYILFPKRIAGKATESSSESSGLTSTTRTQLAEKHNQSITKQREQDIENFAALTSPWCAVVSILLPDGLCGLLLPTSSKHLQRRDLLRWVANGAVREMLLLDANTSFVGAEKPYTKVLRLLTEEVNNGSSVGRMNAAGTMFNVGKEDVDNCDDVSPLSGGVDETVCATPSADARDSSAARWLALLDRLDAEHQLEESNLTSKCCWPHEQSISLSALVSLIRGRILLSEGLYSLARITMSSALQKFEEVDYRKGKSVEGSVAAGMRALLAEAACKCCSWNYSENVLTNADSEYGSTKPSEDSFHCLLNRFQYTSVQENIFTCVKALQRMMRHSFSVPFPCTPIESLYEQALSRIQLSWTGSSPWVEAVSVLQTLSDIRSTFRTLQCDNVAAPLWLQDLTGAHRTHSQLSSPASISHHCALMTVYPFIGLLAELRQLLCCGLTTAAFSRIAHHDQDDFSCNSHSGPSRLTDAVSVWGMWAAAVQRYGTAAISIGVPTVAHHWISGFCVVSSRLRSLLQPYCSPAQRVIPALSLSESLRTSLLLSQARSLHALGSETEAIQILQCAPHSKHDPPSAWHLLQHFEKWDSLPQRVIISLPVPSFQSPRVVHQLMQWELQRGQLPLTKLVRDKSFSQSACTDAAVSLQLAQLCHRLAKAITTRLHSSEFQRLEKSLSNSKSMKESVEEKQRQLQQELKRLDTCETECDAEVSTRKSFRRPGEANSSAPYDPVERKKIQERMRAFQHRLRALDADIAREEGMLWGELQNYDLYRRSAINSYVRYLSFGVAASLDSAYPSSKKRDTHTMELHDERCCCCWDGDHVQRQTSSLEGELIAVYGLVELWGRGEDPKIQTLQTCFFGSNSGKRSRGSNSPPSSSAVSKALVMADIVGKVPTYPFLHVYPLLASQLTGIQSNDHPTTAEEVFSDALTYLLIRVAAVHPHPCVWTLLALAHGDQFVMRDNSKSSLSIHLPWKTEGDAQQKLFFEEEECVIEMPHPDGTAAKADDGVHWMDRGKIKAARRILRDLVHFDAIQHRKSSRTENAPLPPINTAHLRRQVSEMTWLSAAYIELAFYQNYKTTELRQVPIPPTMAFAHLMELSDPPLLSIAPPTSSVDLSPGDPSLSGSCGGSGLPFARHQAAVDALQQSRLMNFSSVSYLPHLNRYAAYFTTPGGITRPKVLRCLMSNGQRLKQLLKSNDDLRQDATLQRFFQLTNTLLARSAPLSVSDCSSHGCSSPSLRTYHVVPLAPTVGIIEWVEDTIPLGEYVAGSDAQSGAHQRYFPEEISSRACRQKLQDAPAKTAALARLYDDFTPALHYFFYEHFTSSCSMWLSRQQQFGRSVASSSMVGYLVGLGDRHGSNLLLHQHTGEVVHIDLGYAFDQSKLLPIPERVPFRLTRNIVDGLGIRGTGGSFAVTCAGVLRVLRSARALLLLVLQSVLHDPLARWSIAGDAIGDGEKDSSLSDIHGGKSEAHRQELGPQQRRSAISSSDAQRALARVDEKLSGYDNTYNASPDRGGRGASGGEHFGPMAHARKLIEEAQYLDNLALMFPGWSPWL